MGLHRDGESLGLPPFETEMRRRLWWRIYMLDARCGLKSGLGPSMMPSAGDSKMPTNLNDSEMHPNSTIYFQDRYGPSEMAVSFLIYSMGKFLAESPSVEASVIQHEIDMTTTVPQARANQLAELPELAKEVENRLTHIMDRFADPSTPNIYELAGHIKAQILSRVRIMASMPPTKLSLSSQPLQPADKLFLVAVRVVEQSVGEYEAMERIGFLWYMKMHFQLDLFAFMVSQLSRQPAGDMVEKAWELVSKVYQYHEELFDASEKSNLALATATTSAWETKHGPIFTRSVHHVQAPAYIQRLGTMVAVDYAALNMASVTLSDVVGDVDGDPAPPWDDLSLAFLDPSGAGLQFPGMF
ncbi:fungal specific transcription factor domain-containing protein [Fusarium oxysporum f. sp. phaseoli]